jgi:hypothetical protein
VVAALLACAAGVLAGLLGGPLWLDEAISVEIARRPLPDLFAALRQDGAPPLYYLLLHAWIAGVRDRDGRGPAADRRAGAAGALAGLPARVAAGGRRRRSCGAGRACGAAVDDALRVRDADVPAGAAALAGGTLALLRVRASASRGAVVALAGCVGALLLTHYWSLFLLAAVGLVHLPGVVRRSAPDVRVAVAGVLGALTFLPWLPTFLFQAAHTGAPWSDRPDLEALLRTPQYWGGGPTPGRVVLALLIVPLAWWAARRGPRLVRPLLGVVLLTLAMAWAQTAALGGAYTGRYTAVVVGLLAVAVGLGAVALPGRWPVAALGAIVLVGAATGVPAAGVQRASAADIAAAFTTAAAPGDVLVYCPDQLGPPVARAIGDDGYRQVVYPTLEPPLLVDWVDYASRNEAASPSSVAAQVDALAGSRQLFVLKASGYRTFEADDGSSDSGDDCDALLAGVAELRGEGEHLFGDVGTTGQLLYRFDAR